MSSPALSAEYIQFRRTFFTESAEMLADMEERLEALSDAEADTENLNAIFRAVHTIKAGAGMFNYGGLVDFAHQFEALLDRIRDGRMACNDIVLNLIVRATDALSELVTAAEDDREGLSGDAGLMAEFQSLLAPDAKPAQPVSDGAAAQAEPRTVAISFVPKSRLLRHANEPLLLIRELRTLGDLTVECDDSRVPDLFGIEIEDAYLSWQFRLATSESDAAIRDVFEFVEDDADLTIENAPHLVDDDEAFGLWIAPDFEKDAETGTPTPAVETARTAKPAGDAPDKARNAANASSIRVELNRIDRLVNMVGELVIAQSMLRQELSTRNDRPVEAIDVLQGLTRELQDCVMAIRMQPVKSAFARMPRLVREVSARLNKRVRLVVSGEHTELDKTVIEELTDPLTHMIRNSIDHGIESPEERRDAGKPEEGTISLSAAHIGSNIVIHITDDGAGLNKERILRKAVEKGIVGEGDRLSDDDVYDLIFAPGFSTAATVSDVSGRGVGMDVVRRNIQKIGGRIQVASTEGKGTRFTLVIPLTLAVLDGMLVSVGWEHFILPLTSILETFRPTAQQVRLLAGGSRVANVRGEYVPITGLGHAFNIPDAVDDPTECLIVLVETASGQKMGLIVDELLGQQQIVIKSLQDNFTAINGISGGTILGNGQVALIIDIEQLAKWERA